MGDPQAQAVPDGTPPQRALPLAGIRVVEFTHMVMGPTCGMALGDLGAEVIKVEPLVEGLGGRTNSVFVKQMLAAKIPGASRPGNPGLLGGKHQYGLLF